MTDSRTPRTEVARQVIRFLILGGTNTLITYAIFVGLGLLIPAWVAYTVAFSLGLAWTTLGASRFVFRANRSLKRILLFLVWYLMVFGVGQLLIRLVNPVGFLGLVLTSLIVLIVTTPITFVGGRLIFGARQGDPGPAAEREPSP